MELARRDQKALAAMTAEHFPRGQPEKLMQVIQELRTLEQDIDFQAAMSHNIHAVGQQTRSDMTANFVRPGVIALGLCRKCHDYVFRLAAANFAYGSTPYHSWLHLFQQSLVSNLYDFKGY